MSGQPSSGGPVFVVGMNGSGTTMMLDCLNGHSRLFGFRRETLIIPHYIARAARSGDLRDDATFRRLWDDFRGEQVFRYLNRRRTPPLPDDWRERPRALATIVDETFLHFARRDDKQRWCEKTPMHAQHITSLAGLFPEARFIHMIRDGRSCAASFHRRWGYAPRRTIHRWKNVCRTARHQARESGAPCLEIHYETLTANPEGEMRRVCEFLGLDYEPGVLSTSRSRTHTGSTASTITAAVPKWRTYFPAERLVKLERIAGRTLAEFGYDTDHPESDESPPRIALDYWMAIDYLRMGLRSLRFEFTQPGDAKSGSLVGRVRSAIRQRVSSRY